MFSNLTIPGFLLSESEIIALQEKAQDVLDTLREEASPQTDAQLTMFIANCDRVLAQHRGTFSLSADEKIIHTLKARKKKD